MKVPSYLYYCNYYSAIINLFWPFTIHDLDRMLYKSRTQAFKDNIFFRLRKLKAANPTHVIRDISFRRFLCHYIINICNVGADLALNNCLQREHNLSNIFSRGIAIYCCLKHSLDYIVQWIRSVEMN